MTRQEALDCIADIKAGYGMGRHRFLGDTIRRDRMAELFWNDGAFILGNEYGMMMGLILAFDLTAEELGYHDDEEE